VRDALLIEVAKPGSVRLLAALRKQAIGRLEQPEGCAHPLPPGANSKQPAHLSDPKRLRTRPGSADTFPHVVSGAAIHC